MSTKSAIEQANREMEERFPSITTPEQVKEAFAFHHRRVLELMGENLIDTKRAE